jgi:hypothetical protein
MVVVGVLLVAATPSLVNLLVIAMTPLMRFDEKLGDGLPFTLALG